MTAIKPPTSHPCGSCPYRRDVPSGIWDASEYAKLPAYDRDTMAQPIGVFMCHQQNGHLCSGWVGCHHMADTLALRFAAMRGNIAGADLEAVYDYVSPVPLFGSGAEAMAHGLANVDAPADDAVRAISRLERKRALRGA